MPGSTDPATVRQSPPSSPLGIVLHVEDVPASQLLRRRILESAGFRVLDATGLSEAWDVVLRERPDVVLTDIRLPDGNGYELTRRIKSHETLAATRVIQISALFTDCECRVRGLDSGADAYIIEPTEPAELVAIVRSMVRGRRIEQLLGEVESRFRVMADSTPVMIWVTDANGSIEFVNRAYLEFFGVREEDLRGPGRWQPLVHPDDAERYTGDYMGALRTGTPFFAEARVRRADGQWRYVASYGAPRFSADGRILGHVGSSPDITEIKEASARIEEALRQKDAFLTTVAHELRQPIQAAVTALGVMEARQGAPAGERAREVLDRQLHQIARVVEDLLEASRIVRGDVPLQRRAVDLRDIVRNSVDTTTPLIQERGHELEISLPDMPVPLEADGSRLQQVLVNVLSNAAKYTPPSGKIRVVVEPDREHVTVRVQDSGLGIPPHALSRIFDVFTRGEGASAGGFGIGLAVARKLVEDHAGTIEARSPGVGKGSEFLIRLPLARSRR